MNNPKSKCCGVIGRISKSTLRGTRLLCSKCGKKFIDDGICETNQKNEDIKFIQDFILGTKIWVKQMQKMNLYNNGDTKSKNIICPMCGVGTENMEKLSEILKKIKI